MVSKINSPAYMDVSATAQSQSVQPTPAEEASQPTVDPPITQTEEAKARNNTAPIDFTKELLQREVARIREANKTAGKSANIMAKCMRIAMRIVQGDNVPQKDDKFLAEHNPELHKRAWMLRVPKEDPEDHESELDDDDVDSIADILAGVIGGSFSADVSFDMDVSVPDIAF